MSSYIYRLIGEGEHQQLDFKYQIKDSKKIARSVAAFANTDGGILLIGVKDNGKIAGIKSDEELYMIDTASEIFCKPSVKVDSHTWNVDAKQILEVKIPKIDNGDLIKAPDENGDYRIYVRHEDMNLVPDEIYTSVLNMRRGNKGAFILYSQDEKKVLDIFQDQKPLLFSDIYEFAKIEEEYLKEILINFVLAEILTISIERNESIFSLNDYYSEKD